MREAMSLLSNPVLMREVRTAVRGRRAFLVRVGFIAALALTVVIAWGGALASLRPGAEVPEVANFPVRVYRAVPPGMVEQDYADEESAEQPGASEASGGEEEGPVLTLDIRQLPQLGRQLLETLAVALLVIVLVIVPAYAGGAISSEREQRTLEMTLITKIGPWRFVAGKLGATLLFTILLLLAGLPVMAAVFLLGGVSPREMLAVAIILMASALFVAALSLYWSSRCRSTYVSILCAYVTMAVLHFGVIPEVARGWNDMARYTGDWGKWFWPPMARTAADLDPYAALKRTLHTTSAPTRPTAPEAGPPPGESAVEIVPGYGMPQPGVPGIVYQSFAPDLALVWTWLKANVNPRQPDVANAALLFAFALLLLFATARRVGDMDVELAPSRAQRAVRWLLARHPESGMAGRRPVHRRLRWAWLADRVDNPVLAKDLRGRPFGRTEVIIRAGYLGIILVEIVCIIWPQTLCFSAGAAVLMTVAVGLVGVLAAILAATSVTLEKEQRTLELLLATPIRAPRIVVGKFLASFLNVQPLVLFALPIGVFAAGFETLAPLAPVTMVLLAEAYALAGCALGLFASIWAERTSRAVGATLLALTALWGGPVLANAPALRPSLGWLQAQLGDWASGGPLVAARESFLSSAAFSEGGLLTLALALVFSATLLLLCTRVFDRATRRGRA